MKWKLNLPVRPSDPINANRWLDVAIGALWGIYAFWGLVSLFTGLPSLTIASAQANLDDAYEIIWAGLVGLLAFIAALAAFSIFIPTRLPRLIKKKVELYAVVLLSGLIAVYPSVLFYLAVSGGDLARLAASVLALSYLVFPAWRIYDLIGRIKRYVPE